LQVVSGVDESAAGELSITELDQSASSNVSRCVLDAERPQPSVRSVPTDPRSTEPAGTDAEVVVAMDTLSTDDDVLPQKQAASAEQDMVIFLTHLHTTNFL